MQVMREMNYSADLRNGIAKAVYAKIMFNKWSFEIATNENDEFTGYNLFNSEGAPVGHISENEIDEATINF